MFIQYNRMRWDMAMGTGASTVAKHTSQETGVDLEVLVFSPEYAIIISIVQLHT
jgi:hypothetical protein